MKHFDENFVYINKKQEYMDIMTAFIDEFAGRIRTINNDLLKNMTGVVSDWQQIYTRANDDWRSALDVSANFTSQNN